MSNLSLARIMYGSSEDPGSFAGMRAVSLRPQYSHPTDSVNGDSASWMNKILTALLPGHPNNSGDSSKFIW
jgi:hypothetical protein